MRRLAPRLTLAQEAMNVEIGLRRRRANLNSPEPYGTPPGDLVDNDVNSTRAEFIVSIAVGHPWKTVADGLRDPGERKGPDVGALGVRWTRYISGRLPIHDPEDLDPRIERFVLVVGLPPRIWIAGTIKAADAIRDDWMVREWERPTYGVPQSALKDWNEYLSPGLFR